MRTALGTGLLAVVIVAISLPALRFWDAAALILRAAGTPGLLGRMAQWDARPVATSLVQIDARNGSMRARVFRPSGNSRHAVLLVTGVHPDGIDDDRLVALATELAGTGLNVITPEINDLTHYRLTASVTDSIEDAALWMMRRSDLSGNHRIGIIGVSFSGGLSIVAAGRSSLRDHVAFVLSFGGHGNLPRVLRYLCTGFEPEMPGQPPVHRPPHDYAVAVVLHQAADFAAPSEQVPALRRGIELFLLASSAARTNPEREQEIMADAHKLQQELPEPSAGLLRMVLDRDVASLGARLVPFLDRLGQDRALSPDQSPPPAAPVYLLHGRVDNVIPPVESALLEGYLKRATNVRRLESGFLSHVDVAETPTFGDAWQMITFWKDALGQE